MNTNQTESNIISYKNLSYIKKLYEKRLSEVLNSNLNVSFAPFAEILYTKTVRTQQELSDYALCNKAHTSRTIAKMQLRGLVKITTLSRNSAIALTKKGEAFAEVCIKTREEVFKSLIENINKKDLETFEKVLNQITANAQAVQTKE